MASLLLVAGYALTGTATKLRRNIPDQLARPRGADELAGNDGVVGRRTVTGAGSMGGAALSDFLGIMNSSWQRVVVVLTAVSRQPGNRE